MSLFILTGGVGRTSHRRAYITETLLVSL